MSQNLIKVYVIAFLAIVVGALYWYFSIYQPTKVLKEYQNKYKIAHDFHHEGKLDEAIAAFTKLSEEAPVKAAEAQAKLKLAYDLFKRNNEDDRLRAVETYKSIIVDTEVPSYMRAIAVSDFMDLYNGTHDNGFARDVMFKGEPFEKYLNEARELRYQNDVDYAMRRAYEFAESLYPLSLAEFRIAAWYFGALDSGRATAQQKPELILKLKEWTEKGENNLPRTLTLKFEPNKVAYMHMSNALNRRALALHDIGNHLLAEQAFEHALTAVSKGTDVHAYLLGKYIRFHYAAFLAVTYKESKASEISAMLEPIYTTHPQWENHSSNFEEFLINETSSEHDIHGHKADLVVLSELVPEFKSYLDSKGIKY